MDIGYDERFEKRWWVVQRASWCVVYVIMLAALLGLLGEGPLARSELATAAGTLELDRIVHTGTPTTLRVTTAAAGQEHTVMLDQACVLRGMLQRVTPEPITSTISPRGMMYRFAAPEDALVAEITLRYRGPGIYRCTLTVDDAPFVFTQVVLP